MTICGMDCCSQCNREKECGGCKETGGHPFGGTCVAAECIKSGGFDEFAETKKNLIKEINALGIENLQLDDLNLLNGYYVNLEYPFPSGESIKLLQDNKVYWGNQIEIPGSDRCFGVIADEKIMIVCTYGCEGKEPELVLYQKR